MHWHSLASQRVDESLVDFSDFNHLLQSLTHMGQKGSEAKMIWPCAPKSAQHGQLEAAVRTTAVLLATIGPGPQQLNTKRSMPERT